MSILVHVNSAEIKVDFTVVLDLRFDYGPTSSILFSLLLRFSECTAHQLLQAPYLVYVEVLRCENAHTAPVPGKILENTLRYTRSEEDLTSQYHDGAAAGQAGAGVGPVDTPPQRPEFSFYCPGGEFDDADCWSQEDDEIIQVGGTPV